MDTTTVTGRKTVIRLREQDSVYSVEGAVLDDGRLYVHGILWPSLNSYRDIGFAQVDSREVSDDRVPIDLDDAVTMRIERDTEGLNMDDGFDSKMLDARDHIHKHPGLKADELPPRKVKPFLRSLEARKLVLYVDGKWFCNCADCKAA